MKYKFLLKLYKSSNNIIPMSEEDTSKAKEYLYTNLSSIVYEFKNENQHLDCSCLDELLDKCLLAGKLMTFNVTDEYKVLKKYISKLSIEEFKILHKFRLIIESKLIDEEIALNCSNYKLILYSCFILILTVCEGGLLYKTIEYRNKTINIGKQLDALIDLKEINKENPIVRYTVELNYEKKPTKDFITSLNKHIIKCNNKLAGILYNKYYINLLNLAFALTNDNIKNIVENYLTEDSFKYSPQYLALALKDQKTLRERYIAEAKISHELYNRKVLIPHDGIILKDNQDCNTIVCECDDKVFGRIIYWYTWQNTIGICQSECVSLNDKVSTINSIMPGTEAVLSLYEVLDKFEDSTLSLINLTSAKDDSGKDNIQIMKVHISNKFDNIYSTVSWNGKNTLESTHSSHLKDAAKIYGEEIKLLAPFIRKLPMGQTRSSEASALAKKLCINLNDNETIVSSFERKQRIRLN